MLPPASNCLTTQIQNNTNRLYRPRFWNKVFGHWRQSYCWWKKSGEHQLRVVVYPIYLQGFIHPNWCKISSINTMPYEWVRCSLSSCRQGTLPAVTESFKAVVKRPDKTPRRMTSPKYTSFPNYFLVIYHLMEGTTIYFVADLSIS